VVVRSRVPALLILHRCPCRQEKYSCNIARPAVDGVQDPPDDRHISAQSPFGKGLASQGGGFVYTFVDVVALDPELRAEAHALRTVLGAEEPGDSQPGRCTSILMVPARSCVSIKPLVRARTLDGRVLVVIVPGRPRHEEIWQLMAAGASDVICDGDRHDAKRLVTEITVRLHRWRAIDDLVASERIGRCLVGNSAPLRMLQRQVVQAAIFTLAPVLLVGESGTGKELVARLLHELDPRPDKGDLVLLDCTTVVPSLSGSEFFGHEKGAFTGAMTARDGAFARADRGTLFLDEVGELPLPLQAELLRVVQEGTYKRVGGNVWQRTMFRLVCATNRNLLAEQRDGRFRNDLYYRIAGFVVELPPLRRRREDVLPLFTHFLAELDDDGEAPALDPTVSELIRLRDYPGNVRDLRQLAQRVHARHAPGSSVTVGDMPEEEWPDLGVDVASRPDDLTAGLAPDHAPADADGEDVSSGAGECDPVTAAIEPAVRRALGHGLSLRSLQRMTAEVAVRISVAEADGSLRAAAKRLGVTERALQLRRAASRS
jgi:transcriptional regulator with GAF, ATPase, and Fis domain